MNSRKLQLLTKTLSPDMTWKWQKFVLLRESADRGTQHEHWLTEHEITIQRIDNTLARTAAQQEANAQQIAFNRQDIASLTAGILDLRNL